MSETLFPFLLNIIPIVALILLILKFKTPAHYAVLSALGIAVLIALFYWGKPLSYTLTGMLHGAVKGFWPICIVIIGAIFCYNIMVKNGSMDIIKNVLSSISTDKRIQALIIAWGFGGFLEGVAGFGTAVAIPTGILIALGFHPLKAATISLISNTVSTAFGGVGIPVKMLASLTDLNEAHLSSEVVLQLFLPSLVIPFVIVSLAGDGFKAIKGVFWLTLLCGLGGFVVQYVIATYVGSELPSIIGSLASLIIAIIGAKMMQKTASTMQQSYPFRTLLIAIFPYLLIFVFILLSSPLFPSIKKTLDVFSLSIDFHYGSTVKVYALPLLNTPGILIIIASIIGGFIQRTSLVDQVTAFRSTLFQLRKSILTVVAIVALANLMDVSGMIFSISEGLIAFTGGFYVFLSPVVGALGTFVTGSDTSSNILFGKLQTGVATQLQLDPNWLAAANTVGATGGKMISPQSIAVAVSATGLDGQESQILSITLKYCAFYLIMLGLFVGFLA